MARTPEELLRLKQQYVLPCVKNYYERPMNLVKGAMQYLTDSTGKEYLDFFAGILSVNSGIRIRRSMPRCTRRWTSCSTFPPCT